MNDFGILAAILSTSLAFADVPTAVDGAKPPRLETVRVRVSNSKGKPIAGAKVKPWAQRYGNGHGTWLNERFGEPKLTVTDENGLTTVEYPASIAGDAVTQVSILVDHKDYCVKNTDVPVPGAKDTPYVVSLEGGTRLRVQAVDAATLEPVANPHIQFLSRSAVRPIDGSGHFFKAEGEAGRSGWYESRRLPPEASRLVVFSLRDDDVPMFSRLHRWSAGDPLSHLIIASLDTGVRFEGMIDPAVPRPIRNGRVVGCASAPPDASMQSGLTVWNDIVPVNEDGSFLFPSLPRDCDLQIVCLCDKWRSALPDADDAARMADRYGGAANATLTHATPQCWKLDGDVVTGTVKMMQTASCRVRCVKADGSPVEGAKVAFYPNHVFYGAGSQIFAVSYRTTEILKERIVQRKMPVEYMGTTDKEGWTTISNLPPGRNRFGVIGYRVVNPDKDEDGVAIADTEKLLETTVTIEPEPK